MKDALEAVRNVMNAADASFEATAEQYRALANRGISEDDLRRYVNMIFAPARVAAAADKRSRSMVLASRVHEGVLLDEDEALSSRVFDKVRELFEMGRGHDLAGKNLWGAYNAVTEYIGYDRGTDDAKRLDQTWFGAGAELNRRALNIGLQMAA